jgi:hypothetical protein
MRRSALAVLLLSAPLLRAAPPSSGFVYITAASGVDAVIDAHYERTPKW